MNPVQKLGQTLAHFFGESTDIDSIKEDSFQFSDTLDPNYLADVLFYRTYDEENKIYENKSSTGFVIEAIPLIGGTEQAENEITSLIREIGEEGSCIQCFLFADHRIDRFMDLWSRPRIQKGDIFKEIALKKQQFLKNQAFGETPPRIFRFIFSYSESKNNKKDPRFVISRLREKKQKALEVFNRITSALEVAPTQLIEIISVVAVSVQNKEVNTRRKREENTWLSKQMCLPGTALEIKDKHLIFHGKNRKAHFKSYEVTDYPDSWCLGLMGELVGDFLNKSYRIPSPFYIHYGIHFPQSEKIEMSLSAKTRTLGHQIKFPSLVRMLPNLPKEYEEHLSVKRKIMDGEKFIETRLSCGLFGDSEHHLQGESALVALFQKSGFKLRENNFVHLPDFISSLPMSWGEEASYIKSLKRLRNIRTTITSESGCLVPIVGEYWGNSTQGMLLWGRKGQLCGWDPFQTDGNFNTIVIGPSGSGKSVLMQEMILNHMAQGGRVYILDLGRSFEKLCHLLSGQFLEFSEKSRLNLNPFQAIPENVDMDSLNASLEMVSSMIATMAMPNHKIDKERSDILSSIVKKTWLQHGRNSCIDDVIANLQVSHKEYSSQLMIGAVESLKEGLKKYAKDGTYA
ncbi:MAG: TraC family protein, partial [Chlamydiae bacterium]|nr:TraC family protein [Chlamydiota bacterium]